jgi:2,4-dienoyl-CoA reductase-like NADH-dependent reductase (Old Yellow Enzyme family)
LDELRARLPVDDAVDPAGPLSRPLEVAGRRLANRFAVLPMEGWDGTVEGRPTDLVRRRWRRFGESGAGLVWGGEAVAVRPDGRANPHQLCIGPSSAADLAALRDEVLAGHRRTVEAGGEPPDAAGLADAAGAPLVGLQLTHSGRWSRPRGEPAPRVAYRHPVLDAPVGATDADVLSDGELDDLVEAFVAAAVVAAEAGFDFVDVKACHGYLGHELLSALDRPGRYGGDLDGRSRFVRSILDGVASAAPGLGLGVRLSLFDVVPHRPGPGGRGEPVVGAPYRFAFGGDGTGTGIDLTEVHALVDRLVAHGVTMLCATASSPYYSPHVQRPAYFPPSDGYRPPHDPLIDVARLQAVTAEVTRAHPEVVMVGSGLTYLQDWFGHVAQPLVADGWCHLAGLGRMVLSYPTLPADLLAGRPLDRRAVCRTFSDCTTAPRNGLVSGCYPLDPYYKDRPERVALTTAKRAAEASRGGRAG